MLYGLYFTVICVLLMGYLKDIKNINKCIALVTMYCLTQFNHKSITSSRKILATVLGDFDPV